MGGFIPLKQSRCYGAGHFRGHSLVVGFACAGLLVNAASAADYAAGKKAFDRGDYAAAAREWTAAAQEGDAEAQYWLGDLYEHGRGVDKDELTGRYWQLLAAERGYEYAQNVLGWPMKAEDRPYLTCASTMPGIPPQSEAEKPIQADSMKGFQFFVTLHNERPVVERPIFAADNMSEKPKEPNIQIGIFRIEDGRRTAVPYSIASWGRGLHPIGRLYDDYLDVSVRIPVEESERRMYVEQYLSLQSGSPRGAATDIRDLREKMLHDDQPGEPSYIDDLMPNRLGVYEIVCRYQSQRPGYWPEALEAPPLRFE
jgi:hypothetical protein